MLVLLLAMFELLVVVAHRRRRRRIRRPGHIVCWLMILVCSATGMYYRIVTNCGGKKGIGSRVAQLVSNLIVP
jgi:drug/metabolite transporter (DMT)-like permease